MHPRIEYDDNGVPWSTQFGDVYHSVHGGLEQAKHVFIAGNHLQDRWRTNNQSSQDIPFVIFETGFGLGVNLFATLQELYSLHANNLKPPALHFISVERYLPSKVDFEKSWLQMLESIEEISVNIFMRSILRDLLSKWPSMLGDYRIDLFSGKIQLRLIVEDIQIALEQLLVEKIISKLAFDAVYLDGFSPSKNPEMWVAPVFKKIAGLCHSESTLSTWAVSGGVKRGLLEAGFNIHKKPGFSAKREMLTASLRTD